MKVQTLSCEIDGINTQVIAQSYANMEVILVLQNNDISSFVLHSKPDTVKVLGCREHIHDSVLSQCLSEHLNKSVLLSCSIRTLTSETFNYLLAQCLSLYPTLQSE